jgi:TRAP-type uncharacterized transport system substrate-binding protein
MLNKMKILLVLALVTLFYAGAMAEVKKPYTITHLVTPFGTPQNTEATALEEVFKKAGSWVRWKAQETPGAMYINKFMFMNLKKMKNGSMPIAAAASSAAIIPWIREGRRPLQKIPNPDTVALFATSSYITVFLTFDKNIKSTRDFVGRKVGIPEKSRIFMSTLPLKPYFSKLGIWKKVDWQFIGVMNSKDALLNDRTEVHMATFIGSSEMNSDGTFICKRLAPLPPEMEIMNSGRDFHVIPFDRETVKKSYDPKRTMMLYPVLIKKGAIKGVNRDVWGLVANSFMRSATPLPKEVIKEIIRVRHQYRRELAKYHAMLSFYPENPYPMGIPNSWINPGVKEAVEELGYHIK